MDCDYDPNNVQKELIESSKGKKKRRRKSKFAKMISEPRPTFDPNDKTYEEYIDEYYKFDCEDIVGDIPCRFKYRKVAPNSFGLTVEEILLAKDRELNKWCSLKKAVQIRPEHVEKYDQIAYERKGNNLDLKKRILPSLFEPEEEVESQAGNKEVKNEKEADLQSTGNDGKKQKKKSKKGEAAENGDVANSSSNEERQERGKDKETSESSQENNVPSSKEKKKTKKHKKKKAAAGQQSNENNEEQHKMNRANENSRKRKVNSNNAEAPPKKQKRFVNKKRKSDVDTGMTDARLSAYGINAKKFKNKLKYGNKKK